MTVFIEDAEIPATMVDISDGGIGIISEKAINLGTDVYVLASYSSLLAADSILDMLCFLLQQIDLQVNGLGSMLKSLQFQVAAGMFRMPTCRLQKTWAWSGHLPNMDYSRVDFFKNTGTNRNFF